MKPLRKSSPFLLVEPQREPGFLSWDQYDTSTYATARDSQPYRIGDVIQYQGADRAGKRVLCRALLVYVRAQYQDRSGSWCAVYVVRPALKAGGFAAGYVRVWPGDIERGEELAATQNTNTNNGGNHGPSQAA